MNSTKIFMPDAHIEDVDSKAWAAFIRALSAVHANELVILGDFLDCKAPARWSKATADEYAGTLVKEIKAGKERLAHIRGYFDGTISYLAGNHENRITSYVDRYAPAVKGLVPSLPDLLDFVAHRVDYQPQPYLVAPGTYAIHGNLLSSVLGAAGQSAFKERVRHGMSIVQGHSHRLGIGWDRQERSRFWMECGHLSDVDKAGYLEFPGQANWQQGFGVLHVRNGRTFPSVHAIHEGYSAFDEGRVVA